MKNVSINFLNGTAKLNVEYPNICPHCGRTMLPELTSKSDSSEIYNYETGTRFALTYRCSYNDCRKYFAIEYIYRRGEVKPVEYSYRPPVEINLPGKYKALI